jgi:bifunctional NMN adenylyltransferase/nudix hydrolase
MTWSDTGLEPRQYDTAVVIGRFQPFHKAHEQLIEFALTRAKNVIVLVGSASSPRTSKNPFTFQERKFMIKGSFGRQRVRVQPLNDELYSDQRWIASVQSSVSGLLSPDDQKIVLIGHIKDDSSYYLSMFPKWELETIPSFNDGFDGTAIRTWLYHGKPLEDVPGLVGSLSPHVLNFLEDFRTTPEGKAMAEEYKYLHHYRERFAGFPYDPVFVTTDAVVLVKGHVLLVKRKAHPGKGLWALPGGFLGKQETVEDSMLRELYEETEIKVPRALMKASLRSTHVFDAPNRSLRGRVITHAGLFLPDVRKLPYIRGADDAEKARWCPITELYQMDGQLFEDHSDICKFMINRAN